MAAVRPSLTLSVTVSFGHNDAHTFEVPMYITVHELRVFVATQRGCMPSDLILHYAGKILECKEQLSVYNVQQSSILRAQVKKTPPGTVCCPAVPAKSISIDASSPAAVAPLSSLSSSSTSSSSSSMSSSNHGGVQSATAAIPAAVTLTDAERASLTWLASAGIQATPQILTELRWFAGNHHALFAHYQDLTKLVHVPHQPPPAKR